MAIDDLSTFLLLVDINGLLPKSPGANIKEFLLTILSEANSRMVKNSF
jgi:hypothetical protein